MIIAAQDKKLQLPRLFMCLVIFMWTIDKLINPVHAFKVYEKSYFTAGIGLNVTTVMASLKLSLGLSSLTRTAPKSNN
jgi:hypothetical protein